MIRLWLLLLAVSVFTPDSTARAVCGQEPDPSLCTVSPWDAFGQALASPGAGGSDAVTVEVRDALGAPLAGMPVELDFMACPGLCESPAGGSLLATTDSEGRAVLDPRLGGCAPCSVRVKAGGVVIRSYSRVVSPDWDGAGPDGRVNSADQAWFMSKLSGSYDPCADYNGSGTITAADLSLFAAALGDTNPGGCRASATFRGVRVIALGNAQLDSYGDDSLVVRNLGGSGNDGIMFELGSAGQFAIERSRIFPGTPGILPDGASEQVVVRGNQYGDPNGIHVNRSLALSDSGLVLGFDHGASGATRQTAVFYLDGEVALRLADIADGPLPAITTPGSGQILIPKPDFDLVAVWGRVTECNSASCPTDCNCFNRIGCAECAWVGGIVPSTAGGDVSIGGVTVAANSVASWPVDHCLDSGPPYTSVSYLYKDIPSVTIRRVTTASLASVPVPARDSRPGPRILSSTSPLSSGQDWTVRFALPSADRIALELFSVGGRRVATLAEGWYGAGEQELSLGAHRQPGAALTDGVYFLQLRASSGNHSVKLLNVR